MFIDRLDVITYDDFFETYLRQNTPCVFTSDFTSTWKCRKKWVNSNLPNLSYFLENWETFNVPVANCNECEFNSHRKNNMKLCDYIKYWRDLTSRDFSNASPCLYLKDWHFQREVPDYDGYKVPAYFSSDWLNEYCDFKNMDDYRFVYMGPKGSWTPLHADVFGSYSWSANICGRKKWLLFPPGVETKLMNAKKQLPHSEWEIIEKSALGIEVIQEPGEIIFVPSGWYHQVWNIEDCISINHNWFNGCNIEHVTNCLIIEALKVENELSDCKDSDDWPMLCQSILRTHHGMNFEDFVDLLKFISNSHLSGIHTQTAKKYYLYDLNQILKVLATLRDFLSMPQEIANEIDELYDSNKQNLSTLE